MKFRPFIKVSETLFNSGSNRVRSFVQSFEVCLIKIKIKIRFIVMYREIHSI